MENMRAANEERDCRKTEQRTKQQGERERERDGGNRKKEQHNEEEMEGRKLHLISGKTRSTR